MSVVTFLSDFGTREGFAASMKGVVLDIAPGAVVVDATHDIVPGDIVAGAWVLTQYWRLYPEGTVHVAVVDPGVGSGRRPIALAADGRYVVAPDNGLVTGVVTAARSWSCVEIAEPRYLRASVSPTFHGRDVFAPAAAHLASGVGLESLGPLLRDPLLLDIQPPTREEAEIRGRVVHIDRFGNLITDIPSSWLDADWQFEFEGKSLGVLKRTYSDVESGAIVVVVGSMGTVEIAARGASAAEKLEAARGGLVVGKRSPADE
jgi:S-adenosylmethionine hydrolase